MEYNEFKAEYERLVTRMLSYRIDQAGSNIYASKLADLVEDHPEFEERYDAENT